MSNKNLLLFFHNKYYTRIEIRCDMQQYDNTIDYIVNFLSCAAKGGNVFVEYDGQNPELEDPNNVIEQKRDTKKTFRKTLWMRDTWLGVTNRSFVEERYTILYIFDNDYPWESFLKCASSNIWKNIRIPQLQFLALFGECQFPCLYLKQGNPAEIAILNHFQSQGFALKHRIS